MLLNSPKVSAVTIADKRYEVAKKFVELTASDKVSAAGINVTERAKLVDLISGHDMVVNTVGPFYQFGKIIAEACIEAQRSCVDIDDDWKPTLDVLALDEQAKAAGITMIVGIGSSPGISNLMAILGSSELDEVVPAWGLGPFESGPKPRL